MAKTRPFEEHNAFQVFNGFQDNPRDKMALGVELEYEVKDRFDHFQVADEVNEILGDFCLIKRDGSLNDGFELNSAPGSLTFHKRSWNEFFKDKVRKKLLVSQGMCGMHVHVNRAGLTEEIVEKLSDFIYKKSNRDFILEIAGREPPHDYADLDRQTRRGPRYYALNTTRGDTVEFRLFKSTYKKSLFFMRLEFVKALVAFCFSVRDKLNGYKEFIEFVIKHQQTYPYLAQFIGESSKWKRLKLPSLEQMRNKLARRGINLEMPLN